MGYVPGGGDCTLQTDGFHKILNIFSDLKAMVV